MSGELKYVLDSSPLMEAARRYYGFDLCPGFWDALLNHHLKGRVISIDRVRIEIDEGSDQLKQWAEELAPDGFFASTDNADVVAAYARLKQWANDGGQFTGGAKADFAANADAWVIAYAMEYDCIVVTHEEAAPQAQKRIPMPNACEAFGVQRANTFEMLREWEAKFVWKDGGESAAS